MDHVQFQEKIKEAELKAHKELLKPLEHLRCDRTNKIEMNLVNLLGLAIGVSMDQLEKLKKPVSHFITMISLVDDIQDNSTLRRGVPTAQLIYGVANVINSVFYIHISTLRDSFDHFPEVLPKLYEALLKSFRGQNMELYWRDNYTCPTEDEYLQMIHEKTGGLCTLIIQIMKLLSGSDLAVEKFVKLLITHIQVHNDYENLNNQHIFDEKGFCEDISEGKFGFPMVHAINTHPEQGRKIMDILRQRTQNVNVKKHCLLLIDKCGSFEYTKNIRIELRHQMFEELKKFKGGALIKEIILTYY